MTLKGFNLIIPFTLLCALTVSCNGPSQNGKRQQERIEAQRREPQVGCGVVDGFYENANSGNAKSLFENNCKSCHHPNKRVIGPKLSGIRELWEYRTGSDSSIYLWTNKRQLALDSIPYAKEVKERTSALCKEYPELSKQELDAIYDYCGY